MRHLMLDLETLGVGSTAPIVAIGIVAFDPDAMNLGETLYCKIDILEYDNLWGRSNFRIDLSTISWWLKQSREAIDSTFFGSASHFDDALKQVASFVNQSDWIWGNGSDFDNVLLAHAYAALGEKIPWSWYNSRCYRTIKNLRPEIKLERSGTHHNALDDATSQANHLMRIMRSLK